MEGLGFSPGDFIWVIRETNDLQLWEDEHPQAAGGAGPNVPTVDDAIPQVDPQWNPNEETSLARLHDFCTYLIRAIKSAVPRTNNIAKAMSLEQEKHESPSHWLERIREALWKHGRMDPEGPAFDTLLKVRFVTKAWPDIRKGVQKDEEWQNKPLEELVRKTQQIYVRRDEEKVKAKAKMMAEFLQPRKNKPQGPRGPPGQRRQGQPQGSGRGIPSSAGGSRPKQRLGRNQCAICRAAEGHWKRECLQKQLDPQEEEVQRIMEMEC
ncbi:hypothetical protein DUI87_03278 [Hirundo rustica rustica]|uniref:Core shell protein Gag P30 domain-containing protein n=1 Tax=Hirundo rustica rustica TaxID=333673 RepID=A0A3M0L6X8_HIRRU|nr:hypothetical protein DUI87_03278 [Hirundo rustica rustica]